MLEKEFKYYKEHETEFLAKYAGKTIVIRDQKVIGIYNNDIEAITKSSEEFELGTFLVHRCVPEEAAFFHSRISFAR
jgi:hypothetical protein